MFKGSGITNSGRTRVGTEYSGGSFLIKISSFRLFLLNLYKCFEGENVSIYIFFFYLV